MDRIFQDLRYGARRLIKDPFFTIIIVLTLAVGVGANTAIFSVVEALLLRPLPYEEPARLVAINHLYPSLNLTASVSVPGFRDYRERTHSFSSMGVATGFNANLTGAGEPVRIQGGRVSAGYLDTYGVPPAMGRTIAADEDRPEGDKVVVVSDAFWRGRLGGVPDVLGSTLRLNDVPYTVIGVMPPGFVDLMSYRRELWVPAAFTPDNFADDRRTNEFLALAARLDDGVTVEAAATEMRAFAETLKEEHPDSYPPDWSLKVTPLEDLARSGFRTPLFVLLGAVGFVLLITCANVANLLLARSVGRRKEVAIRGALGAGRGRIVSQLLSESLVLAAVGGLAGLGVAAISVRLLMTVGPEPIVRAGIALNAPVLLFAGGITLLVGVLFGIMPAVQAARTDLQRTLREGGQASVSDHGRSITRGILVSGEFALALTLLTGAGLMIQSLSRLQSVDPGFDPRNIVTAGIVMPAAKYPAQSDQVGFMDRLMPALKALPGVEAAASTSVLPFGGNWSTSSFNLEGYTPADAEPMPWGDVRIVYPGFDRALGLRLVKGRFFDDTDAPGSPPAVVVDSELVKRYWPDVDPIGRHVIFGDPDSPQAQRIRVIGVVEHAAHEGLDADPRIQIYGNYRQFGGGGTNLVVRTAGDPLAMVAAIRGAIRSVDPDMPISDVRTMASMVSDSMGDRRTVMTLLTIFAGIALLLASLGIYGVMSHLVGERLREMGVRLAFGATGRDLILLVLRQGLTLAVIGIGAGLLGSFAITRVMSSQLYGVSATDPLTFAAVTLILVLTAGVAVLLPAMRAARLDPIVSLRGE